MRSRVIETASIEDHARAIREMVDLSLADPETRKLAVKLASGGYDWVTDPRTGVSVPAVEYHGRYYRVSATGAAPPVCPARDFNCEVRQVWNFIVLNTRYTGDADGYDDYQDLRTTLEAGGGDCFPTRTLVLREDGAMVPIGQIGVGDFVHDGRAFVEVLKTWDRGPKTVHRIRLSNRNTLRLSDNHKVLVVPRVARQGRSRTHLLGGDAANWGPGHADQVEEVRVRDLKVGMDLLQPREFGGGSVELDEDDAWARIRAIEVEAEEDHCVDIMTSSGRVYLPESDTVVRQCDDMTIAFCALLRNLGHRCYARIISLDGQQWAHVYPLVEWPDGSAFSALDATEPDKSPGWEWPTPAARRDFQMGPGM